MLQIFHRQVSKAMAILCMCIFLAQLSLVNVSAYILIFLLKKCEYLQKLLIFFQQKYCELDIVLTTNKLVKLTMFEQLGPGLYSYKQCKGIFVFNMQFQRVNL